MVKEKFIKREFISAVGFGILYASMIFSGARRSMTLIPIRKNGTKTLKAQLAGMMPRRESSPMAPMSTMKKTSCDLSTPNFSKIGTL